MRTLYSIQLLRAVAAMAVVLFHLKIFRIGEAGVDIFFIISGFIMGVIGVKEAPRRFFIKRLIRLVPLYWLVTLTMCIASLRPGMFAHFTFTVPDLLKSLLFIPYYTPEGKIWPLVVPGWTLNYEMLFYLVFTLGLVAGRPVVFSSIVMALLIIAGWVVKPEDALFKTWTDPMLAEFIAGLWLSQVYSKGIRGGRIMIALGVTGYIMLFMTPYVDIPMRPLAAGIPAMLLVTGAVSLEWRGRWPRMKLAERIGDASYSLYMLHGLVIAATMKLVKADPLIQVPLAIIFSLAASYLSYRFFERPVTRRANRMLQANV